MKPGILKSTPTSKLVLPVVKRDHVQGHIDAALALVEYGAITNVPTVINQSHTSDE